MCKCSQDKICSSPGSIGDAPHRDGPPRLITERLDGSAWIAPWQTPAGHPYRTTCRVPLQVPWGERSFTSSDGGIRVALVHISRQSAAVRSGSTPVRSRKAVVSSSQGGASTRTSGIA